MAEKKQESKAKKSMGRSGYDLSSQKGTGCIGYNPSTIIYHPKKARVAAAMIYQP